MGIGNHPTKAELTQTDLDAWANCMVADCANKVTHDSDRCFPHTFGWEAVRENIRDRMQKATMMEEKDWCKAELVKIANRHP